MMTNTQQLKIAESYVGYGGSVFRRYCGLPGGAPYCDAYVTTIFAKSGNSALFCNGTKQTYVPTTLRILTNELAMIPPYISMESDIVIFDWNDNETPDHIGFIVEPISAVKVQTIEGNTNMYNEKGELVAKGVVAYRVRPASDIQAIFRPQFPATFDTSKALDVDGRFGYSSIAMLQKMLGIKVDGILGKQTVKALQKWAGVTQDGCWGTATSKAIQKKLGIEVDGYFGEGSVKALQKHINANVKPQAAPKPQPNLEPKPVKKIAVDGDMGSATVKESQRLFGTVQDGVISGQLKANKKYYPNIVAVSFGGGGSLMVERLQAWVGTTVDGIIGPNTVKAWQKKIGVTADGYFGENSVKAWQKYLNAHDTIVIPAPVMTRWDKANAYARKIAADDRYHYVPYASATYTHQCPICYPRDDDLGWNCIGYAWNIWRHGAGLPCRCSCEVINDPTADKILRSSHETAVKIVQQKTGLTQVTVISAGGKAIPLSSLKPGDIVLLYDGKTYYHTEYYMGNGLFADCTRGRSDQIKAGVPMSKAMQGDIKIAIRYTGK